MSKKLTRGRDLEILIPDSPLPVESQVVELPVDQIDPALNQPRRLLTEKGLRSLAASIQEKGLRNPVHVRRVEDRYILVEGERRWRAHQMAGLKRIRAFVENVSPEEAFELALVENMQREDLSVWEEAQGIEELIRQRGYKQREVAKLVGRSESQVSRLRRLVKLPQEVREKLVTSQVSQDQWFRVLEQKTPTAQMKLTERIVDEGLNVKQSRKAAKGSKQATAAPPAKKHPLVERVLGLQKALERVNWSTLSRADQAELQVVLKDLAAWRGKVAK